MTNSNWLNDFIDECLMEAGKRSKAQLAAIFARQKYGVSTVLGRYQRFPSTKASVDSGKKSPLDAYRQMKRIATSKHLARKGSMARPDNEKHHGTRAKGLLLHAKQARRDLRRALLNDRKERRWRRGN